MAELKTQKNFGYVGKFIAGIKEYRKSFIPDPTANGAILRPRLD